MKVIFRWGKFWWPHDTYILKVGGFYWEQCHWFITLFSQLKFFFSFSFLSTCTGVLVSCVPVRAFRVLLWLTPIQINLTWHEVLFPPLATMVKVTLNKALNPLLSQWSVCTISQPSKCSHSPEQLLSMFLLDTEQCLSAISTVCDQILVLEFCHNFSHGQWTIA